MHTAALLQLAALRCAAGAAAPAAPLRPHIVHLLVDDWGWANAGWHRPAGDTEVQTPALDALVREGVELDRHYVYKFCSPTRSAVQSGRNPVHVNVLNSQPDLRNAADPVSGYAGVPRNMTCVAELLRGAGYRTHFYGKWDAGMATPQHTPQGRGYERSLLYFHHENDYWDMTCGGGAVLGDKCPRPGGGGWVDLWEDARPAWGQNNSLGCSNASQLPGCVYEDDIFTARALDAIRGHDPAEPLFLFWSPHTVHCPLEPPARFLEAYSFIDHPRRRSYHAMVSWLDEAVGNATALLRERGMWDNTLFVCHADNGGPIYWMPVATELSGASNWPLKGGKMSNWEGGIRVNAFVSGGVLPAAVRGTQQDGLCAGWDWYATYAALAGADPEDERAAAAGLPPVDSFDLWPMLSGAATASPRHELAIGTDASQYGKAGSATDVGGLIQGGWKLVVGPMTQNGWGGPVHPNTTVKWEPPIFPELPGASIHCGDDAASGCLYDVAGDPTEQNNVAAAEPERFASMLSRLNELRAGVFSPARGEPDPDACTLVKGTYKGFWGPFVDLPAAP